MVRIDQVISRSFLLLISFACAYQLSTPTALGFSNALSFIGTPLGSFGDDIDLFSATTTSGNYCFNNSTVTKYRCAGTSTCTSNYQFCDFISATVCSDPTKPFRCFSDQTTCAFNMTSECCPSGQLFCPHTRKCVGSMADCCSLNSATPIFCKSTNTCVSHAHQCCSNYLSSGKPMVRCSDELKCVPSDSTSYCFNPVVKTCDNTRFPYFCNVDGTCKRAQDECQSPLVCPPGYFQCPDRSCVAGLDQFSQCTSLKTCQKTLASNSTVSIQYMRCNDGKTCTNNIDNCPTYKSCFDGVICPDMSCKKTAYECVEPPLYIGYDKQTSCGPSMLKCPNGACASSCDSQKTQRDCNSLKKAFCGKSNKCVDDYMQCEEPNYCPLMSNYTFAPETFLCGIGPQLCITDLNQCVGSSLTSRVSLYDLSRGTNLLDLPTLSATMYTCTDGRVAESPDYCATPFACSTPFVKCSGEGQYCLNKQTLAKLAGETFIKLNQNTCSPGMIQCLNGQCRASVYDCPQQVTCPAGFPFQCQDGSCVDATVKCASADNQIMANLQSCLTNNLLLCHSDLKTCVSTLQNCPTESSCPKGFIKCTETSCIDPKTSSCPPLLGNLCTTENPYFCRFSQSCASSYDKCVSQTVCPLDAPVMCATDKSCKATISLCPTPAEVVKSQTKAIKANIMDGKRTKIQAKPLLAMIYICASTQFYCQAGCSNTPCPEWQTCAKATQFKCWNGMCVDSEDQCPRQDNGCPFYAPVRCAYTATCVTSQSECLDETSAKQQLTSACASYSTAKVACKLEGNCKASADLCVQTFSPTCTDYLFPNTIKGSNSLLNKNFCYIPSCPSQYPIKCPNGLCVTDSMYCAGSTTPIADLLSCFDISQKAKANLQYPCGDGTCVRTSDQCPPLYDCALNPTDKIRCSDGSCKASQSECAQLNNSCPATLPYRCPTGQCVQKQEYCLSNDFGCPSNLPFRCVYTGVCMADSYYCYDGFSMLDYLSLAPPATKTTLCQRLNKVPCYSKNNLFYCADSASKCLSAINGCPVDKPILCSNNKCVSNTNYCSSTTNAVALTSTNKDLCPASTPFRCSYLDQSSCAKLPHSSYLAIKDQTCSQGIQLLEKLYVMNNCAKGPTPYSCGDGSCVADPAQCKSCPYFCGKLMLCVGSQNDCDLYKVNTSQSELDHLCPSGTPYLCILNGRCVQDPLMCPFQSTASVNKGLLFDDSCPIDYPIRCVDGSCVSSYQGCLANQSLDSPAYLSPVAWSFNPQLATSMDLSCQVVCSDGSCRDRQENCPVIQACSNPAKPYRCMSGYCAQDKTACIALFGELIENENPSQPSVVCQTELKSTKLLFRCEDGTCRPGLWDAASDQYKTQCLSFLGCPLTKAYQCPTGQCVQAQQDCLQFSKVCGSQYQCANQSCVNSPADCSQSAAYFEPVQIRFDLDVMSEQTINFAYVGGVPVARLNLPANSMTLNEDSIKRRKGIQRITFSPVPQNMTDSTINMVNKDLYTYLKKKVTIDKQGLISAADSVLSPSVFVWNHNSTNQDLLDGATIEFKLDSDTWPKLLVKATDMCLASAQAGSWVCQSRDFNETSDGFVSFPIKSLNQRYAVILSPDVTKVKCTFQCWVSKNKLWVILVPSIIVFLILLVILICCLMRCISARKQQDSPEQDYRQAREQREQKPKPREQRQSSRAKKNPNFDEEPVVNSQGRVETIDSVLEESKKQIAALKKRVEVLETREYSLNASVHSRSNREYFVDDYTDEGPRDARTKTPPKNFPTNYRAESPPRGISKRTAVSNASSTYESVNSDSKRYNKVTQDLQRPAKEVWRKGRDEHSDRYADFDRTQSDISEVSKQPQSMSSHKAKARTKSPSVQSESPPTAKPKSKKEHNLNEQWYYLTNEYFQVPDSSFIQDTSPAALKNRNGHTKQDTEPYQSEQQAYLAKRTMNQQYASLNTGKKPERNEGRAKKATPDDNGRRQKAREPTPEAPGRSTDQAAKRRKKFTD